jgi:hypothetical protein
VTTHERSSNAFLLIPLLSSSGAQQFGRWTSLSVPYIEFQETTEVEEAGQPSSAAKPIVLTISKGSVCVCLSICFGHTEID